MEFPVSAGTLREASDAAAGPWMEKESTVIGRTASRTVWSEETGIPDLLWQIKNSLRTDHLLSPRLQLANNEGTMLLFLLLLFVLLLWRRPSFPRNCKYMNPELLPFYCFRFLLDLSVRLRKDGKK